MVSITTAPSDRLHTNSCDLLEKSYLCGINNNYSYLYVCSELGCDLLEKSYLCGINNNTCIAAHG